MSEKQNKEYKDWLKQSIKGFIDTIEMEEHLEMIYGMSRRFFLITKSRKAGTK
ncbi:MAG: hypothetical protein NC548_65800 [Lachnospiraceae bacterium]|nr:hypothetical protein [Lachnospiraceae bacterium]